LEGHNEGEHLVELTLKLEGGHINEIVKGKCESRRFAEGDAFIFKCLR